MVVRYTPLAELPFLSSNGEEKFWPTSNPSVFAVNLLWVIMLERPEGRKCYFDEENEKGNICNAESLKRNQQRTTGRQSGNRTTPISSVKWGLSYREVTICANAMHVSRLFSFSRGVLAGAHLCCFEAIRTIVLLYPVILEYGRTQSIA